MPSGTAISGGRAGDQERADDGRAHARARATGLVIGMSSVKNVGKSVTTTLKPFASTVTSTNTSGMSDEHEARAPIRTVA